MAGRRWLLIFDNADAPDVLAAHGAASPADHAGWLRPKPSGMVIVTSRVKDPRIWGPGIEVRELRPLDDAAAASVLADLAPDITDPGGQQARELGHRLGGLPLALHLTGSYLASPFARWHTFAGYRSALDSAGFPGALADVDHPGAQARATIQRTWGLSLDALAADGRPQARPLLLLLSCYAPATPVPAVLLQAEPLARLLAQHARPRGCIGEYDQAEPERLLREGLRGLAAVGLIDIADSVGRAGVHVMTVHPVVADANRSQLLSTARGELPLIGEAVVRLVQGACGELDGERPSDWPAWRWLAPHVSSVLGLLAVHLDRDTLNGLLDVTAVVADALRRSGNPAAAENLARSSVCAAGRLGRGHPAELIARHRLLQAIGEQGRNREAERLCRELLADQRRVLGEQHPDTLTIRHDLAWMIEHQGRYAEAEQLCRELLADQQQMLGDQHPDTLTTRNILARLIGEQGKYREAAQLCRQVLADRQAILGDEHPDTLLTRHNLAWMTGLGGRNGEAEQMLRQVLADRQRILGAGHPSCLTTRRRLARVVTDQGRHREAEQMLRQLLTELEQVQGDQHPATLTARDVFARVIGVQGRPAEAERLVREVLADWERIQGIEQPRALTARHHLAQMISQQGRHAEAEQLYGQLLADRQRILGDAHPDTQSTRSGLAAAVASQGRYGEAEELLKDALANLERALGDEHPDTVQALNDLARMIAMQGTDSS